MMILSCSAILICVMVTKACVPSVCCVSPPTFASERKLESHSACSPVPSGGISAGGLAGSNVRLAKATGSLSTVAAGAEDCRNDDRVPQPKPPATSAPSNTQSQVDPRGDILPPASILRIRRGPGYGLVGLECCERHCYSHQHELLCFAYLNSSFPKNTFPKNTLTPENWR